MVGRYKHIQNDPDDLAVYKLLIAFDAKRWFTQKPKVSVIDSIRLRSVKYFYIYRYLDDDTLVDIVYDDKSDEEKGAGPITIMFTCADTPNTITITRTPHQTMYVYDFILRAIVSLRCEDLMSNDVDEQTDNMLTCTSATDYFQESIVKVIEVGADDGEAGVDFVLVMPCVESTYASLSSTSKDYIARTKCTDVFAEVLEDYEGDKKAVGIKCSVSLPASVTFSHQLHSSCFLHAFEPFCVECVTVQGAHRSSCRCHRQTGRKAAQTRRQDVELQV
jgi:hypothetical protein